MKLEHGAGPFVKAPNTGADVGLGPDIDPGESRLRKWVAEVTRG